MVEMWVWQRKRPPPGDRGLTDSPHHSGEIEVHLDSPPTPINPGLSSQPSPVQQEGTNQRLEGHSSLRRAMPARCWEVSLFSASERR